MKIKKVDVTRLADEAREVAGLYDELDEILKEARERVEAKMEEINEARDKVHGTLDDICREADEFFDEKSEKWQEGDRGSAFTEWKDELGQMRDDMAEQTEFEFPEDPERPDWIETLTDGVQPEPNY